MPLSPTFPPSASHGDSPHRFSVKTTRLSGTSDTWDTMEVTVYDGDQPIGRYNRNYPQHAALTFCPFQVGTQWFALYSPDYTGTRIMSLPDCTDIGGEDRDSMGFCPVELMVPAYRRLSFSVRYPAQSSEELPQVSRIVKYLWPNQAREMAQYLALVEAESSTNLGALASPSRDFEPYGYALDDWTYCPFGLVAGCIWGDDTSWKIEYLDLSRAAEGILRRDDRFGYIALPASMGLQQAIDLQEWTPNQPSIEISHTTTFDLLQAPAVEASASSDAKGTGMGQEVPSQVDSLHVTQPQPSNPLQEALCTDMQGCMQMPGLSVWQHGCLVAEYFDELYQHLAHNTPLSARWRPTSWLHPDLRLELPDRAVLHTYHVYHDCGKPTCRTVDAEGKVHFPDHAAISARVWAECGGDPHHSADANAHIARLIAQDMDIHLLKADGVEMFSTKPDAIALLLTGLAEIHANASLFGGLDSTAFKMKWKALEQRGKALMRLRQA